MMSKNRDNSKQINRRYEVIFGFVLAAILIILAVISKSPRDSSELVLTGNDTFKNEEFNKKISTSKDYDSHLTESKQRLISSLVVTALPENTKSQSDMIDKKKLINWIRNDNFSKAHQYLIGKAARAVDHNDHQQLGQIMQLLAKVSASQGDLASAEVYLFESLEIFKKLHNHKELADTKLLIGQMYARRRQVAQMAGWAYGDLLMARFYLSKGSYYQAKDTLDTSIEDNLKLGRTGAVASAYQTMARYYSAINDTVGEQNALIEAGKYYAHSGQSLKAEQVLNKLSQDQAPLDIIDMLKSQIAMRLSTYQSQINLVHQARDYMQLYSLYKSKGEQGRAWQFRIKASEILSRTNKRDMYYRTPDVMAVLYDSNLNVAQATSYYKQASHYYLSQNNLKAHNKAEKLLSRLN